MKFAEASVAELSGLISSPKKIVITTHRNPDADALGSSLGWMLYLKQKGHEVSVVSPTSYTDNLNWIPGTDEILVYENDIGKKLCEAKINAAELIFCLDFNALSRIENLGEVIQKSSAKIVMIDHHQQPENFAAVSFSDTSYCATAEMIHDVISDLGDAALINYNIATCLYVGMVTDNGFFQFSNTTPNALRVAASLVEKGARPEFVSEKINNIFRESRLRFFGYCLHDKLKLVKGGKVAYMMLSMSEIKKFNLQSGDSEGLVNYPFKIEGVAVSVYMSEEPDRIKISFRSRGDVDVNTFARTNFEGGGHKNAAGGKSTIGFAATEKKFLELISNWDL
jgi:phosphoesterase RecJ-like protein